MCGIYGVVNRYTMTDKQQEFLRSAMQVGQVRGLHGAGIMAANWKGVVTHASAAMPGTAFMDSDQIKPVAGMLRSARSAIGHNRHATAGAHTDANCHPFEFGKVVGVHNGTVPDKVLTAIDPKRSHVVDSGRIFAALAEADDPIDVLTRINEGSYSLVWYDTSKSLLHLARNQWRPMSIAVSHNGLYLASELGMLTWLMARHKVTEWKNTELQLADTNEFTLYTIPLGDLEKVTATEYKPDKVIPNVVQTTRQAWGTPVKTDVKKDKLPAKGATSVPSQGSSVRSTTDAIIAKFKNRNKKAGVSEDKEEELTPYEHRASKYYSDVNAIADEYPKTRDVVDFIKSNLMYVQGELYPRAFGSMCTAEEVEGIARVAGFLTNDIGTKEDKWRAMIRFGGTPEAMEHVLSQLPTYDDVVNGNVEIMYPIYEAHIFSYELRPTGEIICIGRPVNTMPPEMYVSEEEENEPLWATYACGDGYLKALDDVQVLGLWSELEGEDDIPF